MRSTFDKYVAISIKVKAKDIVAFGEFNEVCFKKYTINKSVWDAVFNYYAEREKNI